MQVKSFLTGLRNCSVDKEHILDLLDGKVFQRKDKKGQKNHMATRFYLDFDILHDFAQRLK